VKKREKGKRRKTKKERNGTEIFSNGIEKKKRKKNKKGI
jgi:hypothetical protein